MHMLHTSVYLIHCCGRGICKEQASTVDKIYCSYQIHEISNTECLKRVKIFKYNEDYVSEYT